MTTTDALAAYAARQALTVGRRPLAHDPRRVPRWPGGDGVCLGVLTGWGRRWGAPAISADGQRFFTGHADGAIRCWDLESTALQWVSSVRHREPVNDLVVAPAGDVLASAGEEGEIQLWEAATGRLLGTCSGHRRRVLHLGWHPAGERLASISYDGSLRLWQPQSGHLLTEIDEEAAHHMGLAFSPDGGWLASCTSDDPAVRLRDLDDPGALRRLEGPWEGIRDIAFSPDGQYLAAAGKQGSLSIWALGGSAGTDTLLRRWRGHDEATSCVAWSPDGRFLASTSRDATVRLWDVEQGVELLCFTSPARGRRLVWDPQGAYLVSADDDGSFRFWDVRAAGRRGPDAAGSSRLLPALPTAAARLHRLGLAAPLSLLRDLLLLTGGRAPPALGALAIHPGLRACAALGWPTAARVGLVALLLRELAWAEPWQAPPDTPASALRDALATALAGEPVTAAPPPPPRAALGRAAALLDDRLLTLLAGVGSQAVAVDPGLPLRLLGHRARVLPHSAPQRRLLALRLSHEMGGPATGRGAGTEHAGLSLGGTLRNLLPTQLVLPRPLLASRHLRGELLYRARSGHEPPRLRPAVLVLDVSPPTFGPVEAITRLAAHILAASSLEAGQPLFLITAGGEGTAHAVERADDLVEIWTARSHEPARERACLHAARAVRHALHGSVLEPVIVLLTHPYFGAEARLPTMPTLRALFVQYPRQRVTPALASACECWESVAAGDTAALPSRLGRLLA